MGQHPGSHRHHQLPARLLLGGVLIAGYPRVVIDVDKVRHNTRTIVGLAAASGMSVTGVTKATCGDPVVARAMLSGGAVRIGDSRLSNIEKMRLAHVDAHFMLLRTPMPGEVAGVVEAADSSLNSDMGVIRMLAQAASAKGLTHRVILMVEMGELREGFNPEEVEAAARETLELDGVELYGIGMNLACLSGVVPTAEKMDRFEELVTALEGSLGYTFPLVGGGNSANVPMLGGGRKGRTDNLRVGEAILLGLETVNRTPIPNTRQDAFVLEAELIEVREKPTVPDGEISQNAFGETPAFVDRGKVVRGILALGRQDVIVEDLKPLDEGVGILGSSSDHVVVEPGGPDMKPGDVLRFTMAYGALVHAFTSPYVDKVYSST